jgi:hypothetical protein
MKDSARYAKIVEWSEKDQCYVGSAPGLVDRGCLGAEEEAVFRKLCQIVEEKVALYKREGHPLPSPTAGKTQISSAQDPKDSSGRGSTPWLRITAAALVVIVVGVLATCTLVLDDRPQEAPPVSASDDGPWADYRQHLEARYPEQAQETLVALCKAAKDQGIHAQDCDIVSTAERPTAIANALNNEPWFPGWVECVTGSRDEEALATFFKLTDGLGSQLVPALGEAVAPVDEVRTQCGEDITGKVVEVREALYEIMDRLQNDGNRARFVAGVFGKTTYNGSDEGVEAVVEAIDAKEPTTRLALVTPQDEETAETLHGLFNRDRICDAPGCESLGEILTVDLEQQLTATGWKESELGEDLLTLKEKAEALTPSNQ